MSLMRLLIRTLIFAAALICFFIVSSFVMLLSGLNFHRARPLLIQIVSVICKLGLKIFNVKVRKTFSPVNFNDNYLIVSNHLSYLDILIISSYLPANKS